MFSVPEQFSAATKANLDAQFALFSSISAKTLESVEKLAELNLNAVKSTLEEATATTRQLLSAKDAQEFIQLSSAQLQPNAEKFLAYSRHLGNIATTTQAELSRAAEVQLNENKRKVVTLLEEVTKDAPAGTEHVVAAIKSAINNSHASLEQINKTGKQTIEALEANLNTVVTQLVQAGEKAAPAKLSTKK